MDINFNFLLAPMKKCLSLNAKNAMKSDYAGRFVVFAMNSIA